MEIVSRESIEDDDYRKILETESHHDHLIEKDANGRLRWVEDKKTRDLADLIGINEIVRLFYALGYDKNSEVYRKFYRNLGYSLYGYWEIFYWEANNEDAHLYNPPRENNTINPREVIDISLKLEELSARLNTIGVDGLKQ